MKDEDYGQSELFSNLLDNIESRAAIVGVIGLGYVGLPLASACAAAGFKTIGFDVDEAKIPKLNAGRSYIDAVPDADLEKHIKNDLFSATSDMSQLESCDIIVICVPTPLTRRREPDLSYIEVTAMSIGEALRKGQIVVLESTTWPGTTSQVLRPLLERSGLRSGTDFFIGFSPEREDPGNSRYSTTSIPKIVSGDGSHATELIKAFYSSVISSVVPVSNPDVAEAVKITENIFRAVNIALVNELKTVFAAMDIDVWEVIEGAKTKPFGFMPFYPGPGLGGHCIPIDPFYLTWRAREFEIATKFIELAGEVNQSMPLWVVSRLEQALDNRLGKSLGSAKILICGIAYKKNVSDIRESPAFKIMEILKSRNAEFDYNDPYVPQLPATREFSEFEGLQCVPVNPEALSNYDAVLIVTDHDELDYEAIVSHARLIVDTRNAIASRGLESKIGNIVKA